LLTRGLPTRRYYGDLRVGLSVGRRALLFAGVAVGFATVPVPAVLPERVRAMRFCPGTSATTNFDRAIRAIVEPFRRVIADHILCAQISHDLAGDWSRRCPDRSASPDALRENRGYRHVAKPTATPANNNARRPTDNPTRQVAVITTCRKPARSKGHSQGGQLSRSKQYGVTFSSMMSARGPSPPHGRASDNYWLLVKVASALFS